MLTKCNCNHCSTHLEFESINDGRTITCPACGLETKLYIPPPAPVPTITKTTPQLASPISNPLSSPTEPHIALKEVRVTSCYRTLRRLIGVIQIAIFLIAGFMLLATIVPALISFYASSGTGLGALVVVAALPVLGGIISAAIIVLFGIAWKQAALLLVDIADCQIQQICRSR